MRAGLALTDEQRQIVELDEKPLLLIAPPGSGKTEVLIRRAIHLLKRSPGDLFRVLALTYTVKAAEELQTRVNEVVQSDDRWRVTATTFHSFGLEMIDNYGLPVGVSPDVSVFEDLEDKRRLLSAALTAEGIDLQHADDTSWRELFSDIARLKVDLCPPESAPVSRCLGGSVTLREAYAAYEEVLSNAGGVDFEGMVLLAHRLLLVDPWVGEHYRRMYRHVLVDEGQEMSAAQYELLRALCGEELRSVIVVADKDQSINAYAGGGPAQLERFEADFSAEPRYLTTNFRSARSIVSVATELAGHITTRSVTAPAMVAETLATGWVGAWTFDDMVAEAEGVAVWAQALLKEGMPKGWLHPGEDPTVVPEDICILGRTRYAFDAVVDAFGEHAIPVLVRTEEGGLFDSGLGRAVYHSLRFVSNPRDLPSQRLLLAELAAEGTVPSVLGPDGLEKWFELLGRRGVLPVEVAEILAAASRDGGWDPDLLPQLAAVTLKEGVDPDWVTDQDEFRRCWLDYQATTQAQSRNLRGYLKYLAQLQRTVRDDPGVRVLTPHRARGLGFRAVVILGMNEGTFPYYRASTLEDVDEERRNVYVAATRAARALLVTRPARRTTRRGQVFHDAESRFVSEMGLFMEDR